MLEPKAEVIRSLILKHTRVCHITCFLEYLPGVGHRGLVLGDLGLIGFWGGLTLVSVLEGLALFWILGRLALVLEVLDSNSGSEWGVKVYSDLSD